MKEKDLKPDPELVGVAGDIVAAYASNNEMTMDDIPKLLSVVYSALDNIKGNGNIPRTNQKPAVPIDKSVTPSAIICLEDGKRLKMLKRYLRTHYKLTPEEYRRRWGLPADYPMTAPNYAKTRSKLAKAAGLGTPANRRRKKRRVVKRKAA